MTIVLDQVLKGISNEEVADILSKVRPKWQRSEIKNQIFSHSMTNTVAIFYSKSKEDEDAVIVRLNGEAGFLDRAKELVAYERLSKSNVADPLVAVFNNGLIMEPIPGKTLHRDTVQDITVSTCVAKAMARLHRDTKLLPTESKPSFAKSVQEFIDLIPSSYSNIRKESAARSCQLPSRTDLVASLKKSLELIQSQTTPLVVCHNDLLLNNFLYDETTGSIRIIDYEYLAPNPAAFDIANHFNEFVGTDEITTDDFEQFIPDEKFIRWWLSVYLEEFNGKPASDQEIEEWYQSVLKMMPLSHLFWGSWSMVQIEESELDFDYVTYGKLRLEEFSKLLSAFNI